MMRQLRCPYCDRWLGENFAGIISLLCHTCHRMIDFKDFKGLTTTCSGGIDINYKVKSTTK